MELVVTDPKRVTEDKAAYWAYKVIAKVTLSSYQDPPLFPLVSKLSDQQTNFDRDGNGVTFTTHHRFSDFEWLLVQLQKLFAGVILPPVPEFEAKLGKGGDYPVAVRCARLLQIVLSYLAQLPEVGESELMKAFSTMDTAEWIDYKQKTQVQDPGTGSSITKKASGFFSNLLHEKVLHNKAIIFPADSPRGQIKEVQLAFADRFKASMKICAVLTKDLLAPSTERGSIEDIHTKVADTPISLINTFYDHFVTVDGIAGTVRHIEGNTVWVEQNGDIKHYDCDKVKNSPDGLSDPAVLACNLFATQIDSFLAYSALNSTAQGSEALTDELGFWSRFCKQVAGLLDKLSDIEVESQEYQEKAKKTKTQDKQQSISARSESLHSTFVQGVEQFDNHYKTYFVPSLKAALIHLSLVVGDVSSLLLLDMEWPTRLAPADGALKLRFEVPQSICDDVVEMLNSASSEAPEGSSGAEERIDSPAEEAPAQSTAPPSAHESPQAEVRQDEENLAREAEEARQEEEAGGGDASTGAEEDDRDPAPRAEDQ